MVVIMIMITDDAQIIVVTEEEMRMRIGIEETIGIITILHVRMMHHR